MNLAGADMQMQELRDRLAAVTAERDALVAELERVRTGDRKQDIVGPFSVDELREMYQRSMTTWGNRELADVLPEIIGALLAIAMRLENDESSREQAKWQRLELSEGKLGDMA